MITRIVIIGHTGFIGSRVEYVLREHHPGLEIVGKSYPDFDLVCDAQALKEHFDKYTAVIMLAGVKKQFGDTVDNCSKNIAMMASLCQVLELHPVQRLLYFSSAAVYGESIQTSIITENAPIQPTSYYGIGKYACENMLQKAMPRGVLIIRPPQIYGPGDMPCYGPSGFLHAALHQQPLVIWGDGSERREFIYVDDIAMIVEKLLFSEYAGIVNIASGKSYSYQEIVEVILSCFSEPIKIASRERTQPKVDHHFSNLKLKTLFPTFSFTSLSQGIKKMAEIQA